MLGVCLRYAADKAEAEDILQDSFLKIFFNIKDYSGTGSFIGWLRKVAVNTAITHYHKNLKYRYHVEIEEYVSVETGVSSFEEDFFTSDEFYRVLNELPQVTEWFLTFMLLKDINIKRLLKCWELIQIHRNHSIAGQKQL